MVRTIPFLSFIEPIFAWNVPLVSLIFLKRSLVFLILLFSSISLHCHHWGRLSYLSLLFFERWCCESAALNMPANLENSAVATGLEKVSFHSNPKEKAMPKNALTTTQLHSSHMLVKQCSKFSKLGFSNTWIVNFQMFKLVLEKAEEPEIKLPTSAGSSKKRVSEKHLFLLYWLCQSLWLCGSQ